jgi:DNA integrity scanning protein DisA with diadenylate cyclase activity
MGTKHRNCAAITYAVPEAIAIVVSESGGKIRVFKEGKLVMLI